MCESFLRKPLFNFCYHCGRSVSVKLTPCSRCHKVFYCSRTCKLKAWDERHKEECIRVSGGNQGFSTPPNPNPNPGTSKFRNQKRSITICHSVLSVISVGWSYALDKNEWYKISGKFCLIFWINGTCQCFVYMAFSIQHLLMVSRRALCLNPKELRGPWLPCWKWKQHPGPWVSSWNPLSPWAWQRMSWRAKST